MAKRLRDNTHRCWTLTVINLELESVIRRIDHLNRAWSGMKTYTLNRWTRSTSFSQEYGITNNLIPLPD